MSAFAIDILGSHSAILRANEEEVEKNCVLYSLEAHSTLIITVPTYVGVCLENLSRAVRVDCGTNKWHLLHGASI